MDSPRESAEGLFASVKRLLGTILAVARNRLELLQVELREENARLFGFLLLAGVVLILAFMTLLIPTLILVIVCSEAGRLDLLAGVGLAYLAAATACWWRLRRQLMTWNPFAATRAELEKDGACLDKRT